MLNIDDDIPVPTNPRKLKVERARGLYNSLCISKRQAARDVISTEGIIGFNSYDSALQYIERNI